MDKNLTYIAILLDRSGSMAGSEKDVVGGVNTFLDDQSKLTSEAIVTIARFDTDYETIYEDINVRAARRLTGADFVPRGGTALCDAMMRLSKHVGAKLAAMPEEKRPGQVIFLVFSDGEENQSQETTHEQAAAMVKEQEKVYSWKFLFFGMGIDGLAVGGGVGMKGFTSSKISSGIARSAKVASAYVGNSRMGKSSVADQMYATCDVNDMANSRGIEEFEKDLAEFAKDLAAQGQPGEKKDDENPNSSGPA